MPEKVPFSYMDNLVNQKVETPQNEIDKSEHSNDLTNPVPNRDIENCPRPAIRKGSFRPIILTLILVLLLGRGNLQAQLTGSVKLTAGYSDNVFQLSEYDLGRFEDNHANLDFADTTDDLTLGTSIELAYPMLYRWWKFTPSVVGTISQNVSNTDKYRRDGALRLRVDRYYWNATAQVAYNPYIYYRDFKDSDASGTLEKYSYSRNTYRTDVAIMPTRKATVKANFRYEDYFYNEYFTEADGSAITGGIGMNYRLPAFTIDFGYDYRDYQNENLVDSDDSSYQSNIYKGSLVLPRMLLNNEGYTAWQPSLGLNYEQRFYQGEGSWYGGRADYTYTMKAGFEVFLSPKLNISLDYSHLFRNVESDNAELIKLKEYGENRISTALKYKF